MYPEMPRFFKWLKKHGIKIGVASSSAENYMQIHLKECGLFEYVDVIVQDICLKYQNRGKHIITTELEHSSVSEPIKYLESIGFEVSYVKLNSNGLVDLDDLEKQIIVNIKSPSSSSRLFNVSELFLFLSPYIILINLATSPNSSVIVAIIDKGLKYGFSN